MRNGVVLGGGGGEKDASTDVVELLLARRDDLDRLDQNSTRWEFMNCTLQLSLSKHFRVDEKVNTVDNSDRDLFSMGFFARRERVKNILRHFALTPRSPRRD